MNRGCLQSAKPRPKDRNQGSRGRSPHQVHVRGCALGSSIFHRRGSSEAHFLNRKSFEFSSPHKMSSNSARRSFVLSRPGERLPNSAGVGARVSVPQKSSSRTSRLDSPLARSRLTRFSFSDSNSFTVGPLIIWKAWPMLHSHERSVSVVNSRGGLPKSSRNWSRSEEHTSELQSQSNLVCRLLLEKKKSE